MPSGVVCCVILISSGSASTLQPSRSGEMNSTLVRYSAFFVSTVYNQFLGPAGMTETTTRSLDSTSAGLRAAQPTMVSRTKAAMSANAVMRWVPGKDMLHLRNVTPCKPLSDSLMFITSLPGGSDDLERFTLPSPSVSIYLPAPPLSSSIKRSPVC